MSSRRSRYWRDGIVRFTRILPFKWRVRLAMWLLNFPTGNSSAYENLQDLVHVFAEGESRELVRGPESK